MLFIADAGGGNAVGAILASLATDVVDPAERLAAIIASTGLAKAQLAGMSKAAILQYSALLIAPSMLQMIPTTAGHLRPTFNVVVSNVPLTLRSRWMLSPAVPLSSRTAVSSVFGRTRTRSAIVRPLMSMGSRPR